MTDANNNQAETQEGQAQEQPMTAAEAKPQRMLIPLGAGGALQPTNFAEMLEVAKAIAYSGMVPKDYIKNPGAVLVAMQMGAELGLAPMQAIQNIAVINGRPGLWGDAVKALIVSDPRCEDIIETASPVNEPPKWARCIIKRKGKTPVDVTFTLEDAKTAGLWGKQGPWTNYPHRMLQMRARGFACRDAFPDKLKGLGMAEELQDIDNTVDGGIPEYTSAAEIPEGAHKLNGGRKPAPASAAEEPPHDPKTGEVTSGPAQQSAAKPQQQPKPAAKTSQVQPDPKAGF